MKLFEGINYVVLSGVDITFLPSRLSLFLATGCKLSIEYEPNLPLNNISGQNATSKLKHLTVKWWANVEEFESQWRKTLKREDLCDDDFCLLGPFVITFHSNLQYDYLT